MRPLITLTTDFGTGSAYVAQVKGVILSLCREVDLIDLSHAISAQNVREGAVVLADATPRFPAGTLHVAVVDPGVGTRRRIVYAEIGDQRYLAPDNGLLSLLVKQHPLRSLRVVDRPQYWLPQVSPTFHGRDIFAPAAAALARGTPLAALGEAIEPDSLARLEPTRPAFEEGRVVAHVAYSDRFGNLALDVVHDDIPRTGLRVGRRLAVVVAGAEHEALFALTFADVAEGELVLYEDSYRHLALAVNRGSAAELLRAGPGDAVTLRALA